MPTVTHPHPSSQRPSDIQLPHLPRFVVAMALLAIVLLSLGWFGRPHDFVPDQWYGMSIVEGVASYTPYRSEADCRAGNGDEGICLRGEDLNH
jgi:hypothetical protein